MAAYSYKPSGWRQWTEVKHMPLDLFQYLEALPKDTDDHKRLGNVIRAQIGAKRMLLKFFHEYETQAVCRAICLYYGMDETERGYPNILM